MEKIALYYNYNLGIGTIMVNISRKLQMKHHQVMNSLKYSEMKEEGDFEKVEKYMGVELHEEDENNTDMVLAN